MAFQQEVGAGTARATDYHDFMNKLVSFMTSKHVATVAVNAAGTGYNVGDVLTLTHASAALDARFEVLTLTGGAGTGVATIRITSSGAFAQRAASAVVSAGGTGYTTGDVIEVSGGTNRCKAKFQVTATAGVVSSVALFEDGGAYTATPSNPAATVGIGPAAYAGNDDCTLTVTYQAEVGTTGLATTSSPGSGCTVDITLAQTGWTVDGQNTNRFTHNAVTNEKEVVLVGDASGFTNKPYIAFRSGTETVSIETRYFVAVLGMLAHNPSLEIWQQPGLSPSLDGSGSFLDSGSYLLFPQTLANDADFWLSADDLRVYVQLNTFPTATTDNGEYHGAHAGFMDRLATETEDPYPMLIFGSSRDRDLHPGTSDDDITSIAECRATSSGPCYYYVVEVPGWVQVKNDDAAGSPTTEPDVMFPCGDTKWQTTSSSPEYVTHNGPISLTISGIIQRDRTASSQIILPTLGATTSEYFMFPLVVIRKLDPQANETSDGVRGQVRGVFWVYNDDGSGTRISNFSEDYLEVGTARYRVFHNHVHTERYQYIAVLEDV